ncbi:MAG: phosphatase PAP2 family protein [Gloeotrichia echinulata IR180]|jgi:membrane-associated phospholipid phosphatase|nr:phosphatase PAP2 family protein [Gloeotrichia echinulata DEX184]
MVESDFFKSNICKRLESFQRFFKQLLITHWYSLIVLFMGVYIPLQIFEILAVKVWQNKGSFTWDVPVLLAIHETAHPPLDIFALALTKLGSVYIALPIFGAIALILLLTRQWRNFVYVITAGVGNAIINLTAKELIHRMRPHLWESSYHHYGYAFPSGHAMTSMTLVVVLVILAPKTSWRSLVMILGGLFVLAIAWTRLYLGVHFPSDILAGWMLALAWAFGVNLIIRPHLTTIINETLLISGEENIL